MHVLTAVGKRFAAMLSTIAKTIGAMSGAHTHDLDDQLSLFKQRDEYRP